MKKILSKTVKISAVILIAFGSFALINVVKAEVDGNDDCKNYCKPNATTDCKVTHSSGSSTTCSSEEYAGDPS